MVVGVAVLLGVYAVAPVEGLSRVVEGVWLVLGLLAVAAVFVWQIRGIVKADYPGLRAVESTVLTVTLFLVVFSLIYLSLSNSKTANFSESLDRVSAFYFAVTLLATVGFGDISARTDAARIFVTMTDDPYAPGAFATARRVRDAVASPRSLGYRNNSKLVVARGALEVRDQRRGRLEAQCAGALVELVRVAVEAPQGVGQRLVRGARAVQACEQLVAAAARLARQGAVARQAHGGERLERVPEVAHARGDAQRVHQGDRCLVRDGVHVRAGDAQRRGGGCGDGVG